MLSKDWERGENVNVVILIAERSNAAFLFVCFKREDLRMQGGQGRVLMSEN